MSLEPNRVLIVLGMHRSGTSLTANWLSRCGLHIGNRLIGATKSNIYGHYEDEDFHSFHEEVFQSYGIPNGALLKTPELEISPAQTEKLRSLIAQKNSSNHSWGWKDPRTCLFTSIYDCLIPKADYLVVFRDFNNVVDSLIRRKFNEIAAEAALKELKKKKEKGRLKRLIERLKNTPLKNTPTTYRTVSKAYLKDFSEAWVQYNEKIIDLVEKLPSERFRVIRHPSSDSEMMNLCKWLNDHGFDLTPIPFSQIFDDEQMECTAIKLRVSRAVRKNVTEIEKRFEALASSIETL